MALARWQATIVDQAGDIQPFASIEVRREIPGQPLVALFSDRDGLVPMASPGNNPFLADAEGFAAFHVVGGSYKITATLGGFTRVWRYVDIGTAAALDGHAVAGVAGASGAIVGDGATVAFDIGVLIGSAASLLWVEDGIVQRPGIDYTVSGSTVTRTTAPAEDAVILWILFGSAGDVTDLSTKVDKVGDVMTGPLALPGDAASALHAVPKQQLDASIAAEVAARNAAITTAVVGLFDDRGNYDASVNTFPASGGSGTAGAILKGDIWLVSVVGTLGGAAVTLGDTVRALVDTPGQTAANWAIGEANIVGAVTLTATQTLTNKTLTSPVINSPTGIVKGDVGLGSVTNDAQIAAALLTTRGDIITRGVSAPQRVAIGADKTIVSSDGTDTVFRTKASLTIASSGDNSDIDRLLALGEGAAPSTPASSKVALYAKVDGLLYSKDDAGAETALGREPPGQLQGTGTNDSAAAGKVGEILTASLGNASAVNLTDNVDLTVISKELTPGQWAVWGVVGASLSDTTVVTGLLAGINTTTNAMPGLDSGQQAGAFRAAASVSSPGVYINTPRVIVKVATGTTQFVYLVASGRFTLGNLAVWGNVFAERTR